MIKLLLNRSTDNNLKALIKHETPVVLLIGPPGSGKTSTAKVLADAILQAKGVDMMSKGRLFNVDGALVGIEDIRKIIKTVSMKTAEERVFVIENADSLGHEAQNALLKTLEQTSPKTRFILTASHPGGILLTIRSRTTSLVIKPVTLPEALAHYAERSPGEVERYWRMSGGLAGQLSLLLSDGVSPAEVAINEAKEFIRLGTYERLIFVDKYANRDELALFADALSKLLKAATTTTASRDGTNLNRLVKARRRLIELSEALSANASVKLVALELATGLSV